MKLIKGDCMMELVKLEESSVDCLITDPPYSTPVITGFGRTKCKNVADLSMQEEYIKSFKKKIERVLKPNGRVFIFCNDSYYPSIFRAFYDWHSLQMVVWDKEKIGMGKPFRKQHELILYANRESFEYIRGCKTFATVMKYKQVPTKERLHPAQKPLELLKDLIMGYTTEGEIVLDCFMGSGATGVACKKLNRKFIGIELNDEFFEIAKKQLNDALNVKVEVEDE